MIVIYKRLAALAAGVIVVALTAAVVEAEPVPSEAAPEIEMVFVKGGRFRMGCPIQDRSCLSDERPVREVRLGHFLMGKYPVTQRQWRAVMGTNPSYFQNGDDDDDRPVEQVSWNDVQEFINKLNVMTGMRYRLPSEAEWEYAARGGEDAAEERFWGNDFLNDVAWYEYNSGGKTHPVGQKTPNNLGIYDIVGNVWEWVGDWYDPFYYRQSPVRNPHGPRNGSARVYRGCSFMSAEQHCRLSLRNSNRPNYRGIDVGFRLVRTP